jgi:hypothetical protein
MWQQAFKHINKSIICSTVNIYRSQCIAVNGVTGSGNDLLKFLIQGLWDMALFRMLKATFCGGILLATSRESSGRIMASYVQK